jgi:hypothetical protein
LKPGNSVRLSRIERDAIFANARNVGIKITTRACDDLTFRVWRLPDEETATTQP